MPRFDAYIIVKAPKSKVNKYLPLFTTDHVNFAKEDIILDDKNKPTFDNPGKQKSNVAKPVKRAKSIVNEVFIERKPKSRRRGFKFNYNIIL